MSLKYLASFCGEYFFCHMILATKFSSAKNFVAYTTKILHRQIVNRHTSSSFGKGTFLQEQLRQSSCVGLPARVISTDSGHRLSVPPATTSISVHQHVLQQTAYHLDIQPVTRRYWWIDKLSLTDFVVDLAGSRAPGTPALDGDQFIPV